MASFNIGLGPGVTVTDASGATLLVPITDLTLTINSVAYGVQASGSATFIGQTLNLTLNIPNGPPTNDIAAFLAQYKTLLASCPTSDPLIAGQAWNDSGILVISEG